eukprot:TRINITY_DN4223_c0_g2_i1.p1 TRINITY_DN4223_c0_g2~~TRINITY_DN4223_c0_g2_i1.p1  ORF type:complete len:226 (+),score=19.39 TRINITY_DN4223_c0_g2_i1:96-680(+)
MVHSHSIAASFRRTARAIERGYVRFPKWKLKYSGGDDEILSRLTVMGDGLCQHRFLDTLNQRHSHNHGDALLAASRFVSRGKLKRMRKVKKKMDVARHGPFGCLTKHRRFAFDPGAPCFFPAVRLVLPSSPLPDAAATRTTQRAEQHLRDILSTPCSDKYALKYSLRAIMNKMNNHMASFDDLVAKMVSLRDAG